MAQLTQNDEILMALKSGQRLTQFDALYDYGIMRLASRISDLNKMRREGADIPFIFKDMKKIRGKNGRTAHVAEYYIKLGGKGGV